MGKPITFEEVKGSVKNNKMGIPITFEKEVEGSVLADAIERAAQFVGYEVTSEKLVGYKPGSVVQYDTERTIRFDKLSRSQKFFGFDSAYFTYIIDPNGNYKEIQNFKGLQNFNGSDEKHEADFGEFVVALYRELNPNIPGIKIIREPYESGSSSI